MPEKIFPELNQTKQEKIINPQEGVQRLKDLFFRASQIKIKIDEIKDDRVKNANIEKISKSEKTDKSKDIDNRQLDNLMSETIADKGLIDKNLNEILLLISKENSKEMKPSSANDLAWLEEEYKKVNQEFDELSENPDIQNEYYKKFWHGIKGYLEVEKIDVINKVIDNLEIRVANIYAHVRDGRRELNQLEERDVKKYKELIDLLKKQIESKLGDVDVLYETEKREIRGYKKQIKEDNFAETPYVKEQVEAVLEHIILGVPVLIHGNLGAGKTEFLKYICKKYLGKKALGIGTDPEVFSGHEYANPYDLIGKSQLSKPSEAEIDKKYTQNYSQYQDFLKENPKATESEKRFARFRVVFNEWEKNPANQNLSEDDKERFKSFLKEDIIKEGKDVISFFQYGPLLRALKEGRPIILDEIDAIPKSILFRLNDLLVRKPGQKIKIQENGGEEFEIPKGFCILATANIKGEKYAGRTDLDATFLSRFWSAEYNYLPVDETSKIIKAYLIDRRGNIPMNLFADKSKEEKEKLTPGEIQKEKDKKVIGPICGLFKIDESGNRKLIMKSLAQMAEEIQQIFTGEKKYTSNLIGQRNKPTTLEKAVLSIRALDHILRAYKRGRMQKSLEYYIYQEFIKPSAVVKSDAIYLVELFCQGGYFENWQTKDFNISGLTEDMLKTAKGIT